MCGVFIACIKHVTNNYNYYTPVRNYAEKSRLTPGNTLPLIG